VGSRSCLLAIHLSLAASGLVYGIPFARCCALQHFAQQLCAVPPHIRTRTCCCTATTSISCRVAWSKCGVWRYLCGRRGKTRCWRFASRGAKTIQQRYAELGRRGGMPSPHVSLVSAASHRLGRHGARRQRRMLRISLDGVCGNMFALYLLLASSQPTLRCYNSLSLIAGSVAGSGLGALMKHLYHACVSGGTGDGRNGASGRVTAIVASRGGMRKAS